jgi:DNA polymerase III subunit delta'
VSRKAVDNKAGEANEVGTVEQANAAVALAGSVPWLAAQRGQLTQAWRGTRFPHALLLRGPAGVGKGALAEWVARLVLCDERDAAPCGQCASCQLLAAGNHPDLLRVGLEEDARQVKIESVRALAANLGMRSYRQGHKVAIVAPADRMSTGAANALLKTLEEPAPETLLVLVADQVERLPATIASRCQQLRIARPSPEAALNWLNAQERRADWPACLELAYGAPLRAMGVAASGGAALTREMADLLDALAGAGRDLVAEAERWTKSGAAERVRWVEFWAAKRLREAGTTSRNEPLHTGGLRRHVHALFAVHDRSRDAAAWLQRGSVNAQLLVEGLLLDLVRAVRSRPNGGRTA